MKKLFSKIAMFMLSLVFVVGAAVTFTACGEPKETQVMTLSVNPSVEFLVDGNNKVISVTATNEDGVYLLQKYSEFTGMSAKDAALKFLELSEEYGFVVEGSTDGETFTISVSGADAEKLYNDVKSKISAKATELGVSIANMVEMNKAKLQEMVAECYQEYSSKEIEELTEKELLSLIEKSRKETKNLFTDDEKQAYYRERAQKVIEAKIDAVNDYLEEHKSLQNLVLQTAVATMNSVYDTLETTFENINNKFEEFYNNATTGINAKLDSYVDLKKDYLEAFEAYKQAVENNAANVDVLKQQMETLKSQAETNWKKLEEARNDAKEEIEALMKTAVNNTLTLINTQITSILEQIDLTVKDINNQVQLEINALKAEYENSAENPWA